MFLQAVCHTWIDAFNQIPWGYLIREIAAKAYVSAIKSIFVMASQSFLLSLSIDISFEEYAISALFNHAKDTVQSDVYQQWKKKKEGKTLFFWNQTTEVVSSSVANFQCSSALHVLSKSLPSKFFQQLCYDY